MTTTLRGAKAPKKSSVFNLTIPESSHELERAVLDLEDAVLNVLDANKGHAFHDVDFLYWDRKLKNIATPVSQALVEYLGNRRFHEHYRHDPKDYDRLEPVLGPDPLTNLIRITREALVECDNLAGMQDKIMLYYRKQLSHSIKMFLGKVQQMMC